ncbi:MAG: amidohydrolase family protein [Sinobacteraceae bacterium]|nr:amidohydrolase family protein [Nevskiaceae bacterium]
MGGWLRQVTRWCQLAVCALGLALSAVPPAAADAAPGPAEAGHAVLYYVAADFARVPKIDAHVHLHGPAQRFMAQALLDNFAVLTINVDYPDFPPLGEQQSAAESLLQRFPAQAAFATTFSMDHFESPDWPAQTNRQIDAAVARGAVGVKLWKNVGMSVRDAAGHYVMPDDPRLAPVFAHLEQEHIVLLGHQAEPLNCWLPLPRMTVRSDREYFQEHPQYYMYRHPGMPSHDAILAARDRMLRAHPGLKFDAVHLASLEWDVTRIAAFLDEFPDARVDVAARMSHLEYQAARNPDKVRSFLLRYQDRILYGTDASYGPADDDLQAVQEVHREWLMDWRFLATAEPLRSPEFAAAFKGLHLPAAVLDKIYRRNAQALFPQAWSGRGTPN